ncbi:Coenzyme F420 hydrogenase/dehydrogenase, beta subunit C-terminal domain [Alistipes finegoldii]|uniref:Coenzyme F420 hydrogenase/dehydrogenase, beta subunit C-terminal domain n=1 Tax=Alistipes finegoldii TaxID=214856 RepID=UPI002430D70B|nr:Coenzyme F420 hydrogenase/dehydrogenase, beta subunit C-terminal domain [Alistipes finegoldii]
MISIASKEMCCGCAACEQRCPTSCIVMREDEEGFLYPQTDTSKCIDCGLCEKVCPVLNQGEKRKPLHVYAAKNQKTRIRLQSSSGGIFIHIAEQIIQKNGVVFGARFDENWAVEHACTETLEGLAAMRGSKYVQSRIGRTYRQAKEFLESGRPVLFSGTPCQIRGLKLFLAKEYENLLTVDLVCHGVPSPEIWRQYLHETIARKGFKHANSELRATTQITGINFRDKTTGWQHFSLRFILRRETGSGLPETADVSRIHYKDPFFYCFLSHVTERYSCYACPAKELKSGSDITLGDFWGFRGTKDFPDDNNGISLLLINTDQGSKYITGTLRSEQSYEKVIKQNPMITASLIKDPRRDTFYKAVAKSSLHRQSKKLRLINKIKRYANRLADLALGNRIR